MIDSAFIDRQKTLLVQLGDRLGSEVDFCKQFIGKAQRPAIEIEWMQSAASSFNYGAFLIKSALSTIEGHKNLPSEQLAYYVGKIAIQPFLETINSYEQLTNKLLLQNPAFKSILNKRAEAKVQIIEDSWDTCAKGKSKKLKDSLTRHLKHKTHEMAFIRDTMKAECVIDSTDHGILSFAWDIRNSMHLNYTAIKDIDFKYPDIKTGEKYHFHFKRGQELFHPNDLVSFQVITEQIVFILLKILQRYPDEGSA